MRHGFNAQHTTYADHKAKLDSVSNEAQLLLWLKHYAQFDLGPHQPRENREILDRLDVLNLAAGGTEEGLTLARVKEELASGGIDKALLSADLDRITMQNLRDIHTGPQEPAPQR